MCLDILLIDGRILIDGLLLDRSNGRRKNIKHSFSCSSDTKIMHALLSRGKGYIYIYELYVVDAMVPRLSVSSRQSTRHVVAS